MNMLEKKGDYAWLVTKLKAEFPQCKVSLPSWSIGIHPIQTIAIQFNHKFIGFYLECDRLIGDGLSNAFYYSLNGLPYKRKNKAVERMFQTIRDL